MGQLRLGEARLGTIHNYCPHDSKHSCAWHSQAVRLESQVAAGFSIFQAYIIPSLGTWSSTQPWCPYGNILSEDTLRLLETRWGHPVGRAAITGEGTARI